MRSFLVITNIMAGTAVVLLMLALAVCGCISCSPVSAETPDEIAGRVVELAVVAEVLPTPEAIETETAADVWTLTADDDVPYAVPCAACPSGTRHGTFAEVAHLFRPGRWFRNHRTRVWAYAVTEPDGQTSGWYYYDRPGPLGRLVPNPRYRRAAIVAAPIVQQAPAVQSYQPPPQTIGVPWSGGWGGMSGGGCPTGGCPTGGCPR